MRLSVRKTPKYLVLSPKAQIVMGVDEATIQKMAEFHQLRDEYIRFRDFNHINKITQFEIEQVGLEAAIKAHERK